MNELQICSQFLTQKLNEILDIPVFNGIQEEQDNLNTYCVFFINEIEPVKYVSNIQAFSNCDVYIDIWSKDGYSYDLAEKLNSLLDGQQGEVIGEGESIGYVNSCIFQAQHSMTPYDNEGWYGVQAQYTVRVQGISEKPKPDIRYYQEDIENAIIKKRNLQGADLTTIPPNKMADEIDRINLGMSPGMEGGGYKWQRPSDWPDLDSIFNLEEAIKNDTEIAFFTYDNRDREVLGGTIYTTCSFRYDCTIDVDYSKPPARLSVGYVENGEYIVLEDYDLRDTVNGSYYTSIDYSNIDRDFIVFRVLPPTDTRYHINELMFMDDVGNSRNSHRQRCLECVGNLPYKKAFTFNSTGGGNLSYANATTRLQRYGIVFGKYSGSSITSFVRFFWRGQSLVSIDGLVKSGNLYAKNWNVNSLSNMFLNCYSVKEIDFSGWDTSNWNLTNIDYLFNDCRSLYYFNLDGWFTKNRVITYASRLFYNCWSLPKVDLRNWDVSNWTVDNIAYMFSMCFSLKYLDLSTWDVRNWNLTTMDYFCNMTYCSFITFKVPFTATTRANTYRGSCPQNTTSLINYEPVKNLKLSQNYSTCISLTRQSLLNIIYSLPTLASGESFTLTLGTELQAKLTLEEMEIATNKGWTIA